MTKQTYIHFFKSGIKARIQFLPPKPGEPSTYNVEWFGQPQTRDLAEYRNEWRQVILADVAALDGRTDHRMIDDAEMALSPIEASR